MRRGGMKSCEGSGEGGEWTRVGIYAAVSQSSAKMYGGACGVWR